MNRTLVKSCLRQVLLFVAVGSLAVWATREYHRSKNMARRAAPSSPTAQLPVIDDHQVVMTYFISGSRCRSCKKIEQLTRETAEQDFSTELASKRLIFRVIDIDQPANHQFLQTYQLTSKTVILSHRVGNQETKWEAMEEVWELLDQPTRFRAYLASGIRRYLKS